MLAKHVCKFSRLFSALSQQVLYDRKWSVQVYLFIAESITWYIGYTGCWNGSFIGYILVITTLKDVILPRTNYVRKYNIFKSSFAVLHQAKRWVIRPVPPFAVSKTSPGHMAWLRSRVTCADSMGVSLATCLHSGKPHTSLFCQNSICWINI